METSGADWKFWQWVVGGAVSVVSGLVGGAWISRGVLEELRNSSVDHGRRIAAMENQMESLKSISTSLAVLTALHGEMKEELGKIFARCERRYHSDAVEEERRKS